MSTNPEEIHHLHTKGEKHLGHHETGDHHTEKGVTGEQGNHHHSRLGLQAVDLLTHPGSHATRGASARVADHDHLVLTPLNAGRTHPVAALVHPLLASGEGSVKRTGGGGGTEGDRHNGSAAAKSAIEAKLDPTKSVADLVKSGVIRDGSAHAADRDYTPLKPGETPHIRVVYENKDAHSHTPQPKPNFIVDKHGAITVVHNPEGVAPDRDVVIQVQRDRGNAGRPPAEQQASIDALVNYEGNRIVAKHGAHLAEVQTTHGAVKQVPISDDQGLVSDNVHHQLGDRLAPQSLRNPNQAPPQVSRDVQDTSDRMNRVRGSHGSTMVPRESAPGRREGDTSSPAGYDQMVAPREVPAPRSEAPAVVSFKDALAALFHPDRTDPSHTIREVPGAGYRVGRYGMNQGFTMSGLAEMLGVNLGDPPDMSKLQDYLAQHPDAMQKAMHQYAERLRQDADADQLPADDKLRQAADNMDKLASNFGDPNFQAGFVKFLGDMKGGGDPITAERLDQFMPKELQEALAEGGINHLAKAMHIDPTKISEQDAGKLALGVALGRTPTDADLANQQYQAYSNAAGNMNDVTEARQHGAGNIHVRDNNGRISASAERLAETADSVASRTNTVGYCAGGVARAVDASVGSIEHANAWDYGKNLLRSGKFELVGSLSDVGQSGLQRGDVVVRSWNRSVQAQHNGQNWGDVAVILGKDTNGAIRQANDHHQELSADGGRYQNSYVLRLRDSADA